VDPPSRRRVWRRPDDGWCKVNIDASFVSASRSGSGGAVIRDDSGKILEASSKFYEHIPDVVTAEAMAARDGLLLARACGHEKVVLEVDNLALVNLLRSEAGERSPVAGLWHETREIGRQRVCSVSYFVCKPGRQ